MVTSAANAATFSPVPERGITPLRVRNTMNRPVRAVIVRRDGSFPCPTSPPRMERIPMRKKILSKRCPGSTDPPRQTARRYRAFPLRSEEHTSELQSRRDLVCRLLLEKKKKIKKAA